MNELKGCPRCFEPHTCWCDSGDYNSSAVVVLKCDKSYHDVNTVGFVNIEEDFYGRDLMTFICPKCKEEHQSLVLG